MYIFPVTFNKSYYSSYLIIKKKKTDVSEMTFPCFRLNLNNNFYDKLVSFFSFSFFLVLFEALFLSTFSCSFSCFRI